MVRFLIPFVLLLAGIAHAAFGKFTVSKFANPNFCTTYPSGYATGSFSITETSKTGSFGFAKGQTNATLIIGFSNASFSFNPGVGTVTTTGTEVTISSYTITATAITVTLSTAATNVEFNSLSFNNLQVRATAAATGYIRRTGGTFKIDNKTSLPSGTYSLGDLTAGTPLAYSTSSATQPVTSSVFSGSTDNQVIGVQLTLTGTCANLTATTFNFNTTGSTSASTSIAAARLYYSGNVNTFSANTLFGSVANPNGAFSITGSQTLGLGAGTYYFWLVYDIKPLGTAVAGHVVDAQFVSAVLSGTTHTTASGNPAGSRTISDNVFYSIATGNWNSTAIWSRTSGGASCSCAPTAGVGAVYVNHPVLLNSSYTVDIVQIQNGGNLTNSAGAILTVSNRLNTSGTGVFTASSSWVLNNMTANGTGTLSSSAALAFSGTMLIGTGKTVQMTGGAGLTVNGNSTIDGTLALGTSNWTTSNAAGTILNGTGSITGTGIVTLGVGKTIPAGSVLSIAPVVNIANNVTITNLGTVTMQSSITGGGLNARWINGSGSSLTMAGTTSTILATGSLDASAVPNTVTYSGSGAQIIETPSPAAYHHLTLSNAGAKSMQAALAVNGDLLIAGTAQLSAGAAGNTLTVLGNWTNNSSNAAPFSPSTSSVLFNGQTAISGTGVNAFNIFNITSSGNVVAHPTAGRVFIAGNFINDGYFDNSFSDVTFNGTTTVSGTSTTLFYSVNVNAGSTLTLHATETDMSGNLNSPGTLNHNGGLLNLIGPGTPQSIGGSATALTLNALEIGNAGNTITLDRPVTVNTALTLTDGFLATTTANLLTLAAGSTSAGGSATTFVSGPMAKTGTTAFVFPVGKSGRFARIAIGAPSASSTFRAEYFPVPYANTTTMAAAPTPKLNDVSDKEYWLLDRTAGTGSAAVTLYYEDAGWSGIDNCSAADFRVARWNGSAWANAGNTPAVTGTCSGATAGTVSTGAQVTTFSPFTFGSTTFLVAPLPVRLTAFSAGCGDRKVVLTWTTAEEMDNDFFAIERSLDGRQWEEIGQVDGAGSTASDRTYAFSDLSPAPATAYYRLRQTDLDGAFEHSAPVSVQSCLPKTAGAEVALYPNPSEGKVYLAMSGGDAGACTLEVVNLLGRRVYRASSLTPEVDLSALGSGVYYFRIRHAFGTQVEKVVIER